MRTYAKKSIGLRFGRLIVIEILPVRKNKQIYVNCLCDCGNFKEIRFANLPSGRTISCGCRQLETLKHVPKKAKGETGFSSLYAAYGRSAKYRDIGFYLSRDQFRNLVTQNCHYCGVEPLHKKSSKQFNEENKKHSEFTYNGIDRIDSNKDYTLDNCVPCCGVCNRAKCSDSYTKFKEWIRRLQNKKD